MELSEQDRLSLVWEIRREADLNEKYDVHVFKMMNKWADQVEADGKVIEQLSAHNRNMGDLLHKALCDDEAPMTSEWRNKVWSIGLG